MAKFWQVIKAFQKGSSVEAERLGGPKVKAVKEEDSIVFYDHNDKLFEFQGIGTTDLTEEWTIIKKPKIKTYKYIQMTLYLFDGVSLMPKSYSVHDTDLESAKFLVKQEHSKFKINIVSAVGIHASGRISVLIEKGQDVNQ